MNHSPRLTALPRNPFVECTKKHWKSAWLNKSRVVWAVNHAEVIIPLLIVVNPKIICITTINLLLLLLYHPVIHLLCPYYYLRFFCQWDHGGQLG